MSPTPSPPPVPLCPWPGKFDFAGFCELCCLSLSWNRKSFNIIAQWLRLTLSVSSFQTALCPFAWPSADHSSLFPFPPAPLGLPLWLSLSAGACRKFLLKLRSHYNSATLLLAVMNRLTSGAQWARLVNILVNILGYKESLLNERCNCKGI